MVRRDNQRRFGDRCRGGFQPIRAQVIFHEHACFPSPWGGLPRRRNSAFKRQQKERERENKSGRGGTRQRDGGRDVGVHHGSRVQSVFGEERQSLLCGFPAEEVDSDRGQGLWHARLTTTALPLACSILLGDAYFPNYSNIRASTKQVLSKSIRY